MTPAEHNVYRAVHPLLVVGLEPVRLGDGIPRHPAVLLARGTAASSLLPGGGGGGGMLSIRRDLL